MSTSDITVRCANAVMALIKATKPKCVTLSYWIFNEGGKNESAPYLKAPSEDEWGTSDGWIHAYAISQVGWKRAHLGVSKFEDIIPFKLWAFYGWNLGDVTKNSEHVFLQHLADVSDALSAATKFQQTATPNGVPEVKGHDDWQIEDIGVYFMGMNKVHIAQGTINVKFNRLINPIPIT